MHTGSLGKSVSWHSAAHHLHLARSWQQQSPGTQRTAVQTAGEVIVMHCGGTGAGVGEWQSQLLPHTQTGATSGATY